MVAGLLMLSEAVAAAPPPEAAPMRRVSAEALARVLAALPAEEARGPRHIAARIAMPLGLQDGRWTAEADANGARDVWRLALRSPGASLLIVSFDRFELPEGAELRAFAGDRVRGPYTGADRNRRGGLTLPFLPGEEMLLELRGPAGLRDRAVLDLDSLGHGMAPLNADGFPAPKSGSCNIDVACPQGDLWRDQIRSVVALQIPAGGGLLFTLCSGQLMNNTRQDKTPYVLTASHCGVSSFNDDNVVALFNFQTSSCGRTPPNGSEGNSIEGARFLADHSLSDFSLLQLDRTPPASFNVYYSGFNASTTSTPQRGVAIHHPSGDEKRISCFSTPPVRQRLTLQGGQVVESFRVRWSQGVTETGSSGGGLWNERRQFVGSLSGGDANCSNPNGFDYFGRLDVAWVNGLQPFLDPARTGRFEFCGANHNASCTPDPAPAPLAAACAGEPKAESDGDGGGGAFGAGLILLAFWIVRRRRPANLLVRGA